MYNTERSTETRDRGTRESIASVHIKRDPGPSLEEATSGRRAQKPA